jgi:hypothetical protein
VKEEKNGRKVSKKNKWGKRDRKAERTEERKKARKQ